VFEWQVVMPVLSVQTLSGVLACFVLLRPSAVWRLALLCAVLAVEFVTLLPNPYSAGLLLHLSAVALAGWFALRLLRDRAVPDHAEIVARVLPFLRWGLLLAWFSDAISKLNTGFLSSVGTCAPHVLEELPLLHIGEDLFGPLAITQLLAEFAIPLMLIFPRTRTTGVALAAGWYALIALGGNPANAALMFAFVLLFLPAATLSAAGARLRETGRTLTTPQLRTLARARWALAGLAAVWIAGLTMNEALPYEIAVRLSRWSAIAIVVAWIGLWAMLLVQLRPGRGDAHALRLRDGLLVCALAVMVLNSLCPYVGLKTDWSFSQYGNLRTETGHWNHLVLPEAMRVFGTQDHLVRLIAVDGDDRLAGLAERNGDNLLVLPDARRMLAAYDQDASVYYELDGVRRFALRLGEDHVLGGGVSPLTNLLGRWRRVPLEPTCQF
jgi:hypothetical protein